MSNIQSRTATTTVATTQNRLSGSCLALSYVMAIALIFLVPSQASQLSSKEYNVLVFVWAMAAILGICVGVVYLALSVGSKMRTALAFVSLFLALTMLAMAAMPFVSETFYGFLSSLLGA